MGMSTHVMGMGLPDEKWLKYVEIYNLCKSQKIEVPAEIAFYFGEQDPNKFYGNVIDIKDCVTEYEDDMRQGFDVDISRLPPAVKFIRFYNSW